LLLLFNAGPLDITFAQESPEVNAIIACGYPAQAAGEALYRVLTATGPRSVPAGRLTATWPAQLNQVLVLAKESPLIDEKHALKQKGTKFCLLNSVCGVGVMITCVRV